MIVGTIINCCSRTLRGYIVHLLRLRRKRTVLTLTLVARSGRGKGLGKANTTGTTMTPHDLRVRRERRRQTIEECTRRTVCGGFRKTATAGQCPVCPPRQELAPREEMKGRRAEMKRSWEYMYACVANTFSRVWINRVWLPNLLVVS